MIAAGSLIFCHSKGTVSWAIRVAQGRKAQWNHVAIAAETGENPLVIQAEGHGVTSNRRVSQIAPGGSWAVVAPPKDVCPKTQLAFGDQQVGDRYGFLTIASILVTLFTPKFVNVMLPDTWICSALAGESLRAGGWIHRWSDVYQVTPQQLYDSLVIP